MADVRGWPARLKAEHPKLAGVVAAAGAVVAGYVVVEGIWSTFSSDPLVPWLWRKVEPLLDELARAFALGALAVLVISAILTQRSIARSLKLDSPVDDDATLIEGNIRAGGTMRLTITINGEVKNIDRAWFSARQGRLVIYRRRPARIIDNNHVELAFSPSDTRDIRDGFLHLEVSYKDGSDVYVLNQFRIATTAALVA